MPRTESRTKTGIWGDDDFCKLPRDAQRRYWQLYSQSNISLCGVVAYTPGRWCRQASDDSLEAILYDLGVLQEHHFIVADFDTEEILVRSFMRNDGVWKSPKTREPAKGASKGVLSIAIRTALGREMDRLAADFDTQSDTPCEGN